MKKLLIILCLILGLSVQGQSLLRQFGTTNTGPVLTNIIVSLAGTAGGATNGILKLSGHGTNTTIHTNLTVNGDATVTGQLTAQGNVELASSINASGNPLSFQADAAFQGFVSTLDVFYGDGSGITNAPYIGELNDFGTNLSVLRLNMLQSAITNVSNIVIGGTNADVIISIPTRSDRSTNFAWQVIQESFDYGADRPVNELFGFHYNIDAGGSLINQTRHGVRWGMEPHYQPASTVYFEPHLTILTLTNGSTGVELRLASGQFEPNNITNSAGWTLMGPVRIWPITDPTMTNVAAFLSTPSGLELRFSQNGGTNGIAFSGDSTGGTTIAKLGDDDGPLNVSGFSVANFSTPIDASAVTAITITNTSTTDALKAADANGKEVEVVIGANLTYTPATRTLAATGGGSGINYANGNPTLRATNSTDASFMYSGDTPAIHVDSDTTGIVKIRNMAGSLMATFDTVMSLTPGTSFSVVANGNEMISANNGGLTLSSPDGNVDLLIENTGWSASNPAWTSGRLLMFDGDSVETSGISSTGTGAPILLVPGTLVVTNETAAGGPNITAGTNGVLTVSGQMQSGSVVATNGIETLITRNNTGVIPLGGLLYTNISGATTLGLLSAAPPSGFEKSWAVVVTNATSGSLDVTFHASFILATNSFTTTNVVTLPAFAKARVAGVAETAETNGAAVRWYKR